MNTLIWLGLLILFLVVEAGTVALVSLWFAAGALVAMIASALGAALWLQLVIFLAVSAALLASLRPLLRKYFCPKISATNVDSIPGKQGYVIADIDNLAGSGQVKLGAMEWSARSTSGEPISSGTLVQVDKVEGVKVFVSKV